MSPCPSKNNAATLSQPSARYGNKHLTVIGQKGTKYDARSVADQRNLRSKPLTTPGGTLFHDMRTCAFTKLLVALCDFCSEVRKVGHRVMCLTCVDMVSSQFMAALRLGCCPPGFVCHQYNTILATLMNCLVVFMLCCCVTLKLTKLISKSGLRKCCKVGCLTFSLQFQCPRNREM